MPPDPRSDSPDGDAPPMTPAAARVQVTTRTARTGQGMGTRQAAQDSSRREGRWMPRRRDQGWPRRWDVPAPGWGR